MWVTDAQTWLRSHVAVAVVKASSRIYASTSSLGPSVCCRHGPKKKKKKKKKKKIMLFIIAELFMFTEIALLFIWLTVLEYRLGLL